MNKLDCCKECGSPHPKDHIEMLKSLPRDVIEQLECKTLVDMVMKELG
jgi:hypothetical protein